jgi:hypothetical protein
LDIRSWKFKYGKTAAVRQVVELQTAALAFGGQLPPATGATEEYDGSTWTTSPGSLNTARSGLAGCGTQTAALAFGGGPPYTAATEEWTGAGVALTKTVTVS